jgi:predicted nuclease of predicted toxin-antitoxin system
VHVSESDPRLSDREILEWAVREQRVCVTRDADFHALLASTNATSPSVIRIRIEELTFSQLAEILHHVADRFATALEAGAAVSVTPGRMRVRRLPLVE